MALLRKPSERPTVEELKLAIIAVNRVAKRTAIQDTRHAVRHARLNELLDQLTQAKALVKG